MAAGGPGKPRAGTRASSAEALFAVNGNQRIVAWNSEAVRLFGYPAATVLGRPCFTVVCGRERGGARFCRSGCTVMQSLESGTPPPTLRLQVRDRDGEQVPIDVSTITLRSGDDEAMVIHLCRGAAMDPPEASLATTKLTAREQQVLGALCRGASTAAMAEQLGVSTITVRNHVQRLLAKLATHSRAEAVALAFREGFPA